MIDDRQTDRQADRRVNRQTLDLGEGFGLLGEGQDGLFKLPQIPDGHLALVEGGHPVMEVRVDRHALDGLGVDEGLLAGVPQVKDGEVSVHASQQQLGVPQQPAEGQAGIVLAQLVQGLRYHRAGVQVQRGETHLLCGYTGLGGKLGADVPDQDREVCPVLVQASSQQVAVYWVPGEGVTLTGVLGDKFLPHELFTGGVVALTQAGEHHSAVSLSHS